MADGIYTNEEISELLQLPKRDLLERLIRDIGKKYLNLEIISNEIRERYELNKDEYLKLSKRELLIRLIKDSSAIPTNCCSGGNVTDTISSNINGSIVVTSELGIAKVNIEIDNSSKYTIFPRIEGLFNYEIIIINFNNSGFDIIIYDTSSVDEIPMDCSLIPRTVDFILKVK